MNPEPRQCQNCKSNFVIEPDDFAFYEKIHVPPPTWCPECRFLRRLIWRNERTLYKRTCSACSNSIITVYNPKAEVVVYCADCWWKDNWDPIDYGQAYDFSKPFFEQFHALRKRVPVPAVHSLHTTLVNSEYTNMVGNLKNCYLIFNSDYNENCSYGTEIEHSKECYDNILIDECELCYGNVNCQKCF